MRDSIPEDLLMKGAYSVIASLISDFKGKHLHCYHCGNDGSKILYTGNYQHSKEYRIKCIRCKGIIYEGSETFNLPDQNFGI
jgi:hypothetical protein